MGSQAEPKLEDEPESDTVAWIGREPAAPAPLTPGAVPPAVPQIHGEVRIKASWVIAGVLGMVVLAAGLWWMTRSAAPAARGELDAIPLVSVIAPRALPVTASVSFSGAIFARYDMPIGNSGDPARIESIYVEAGDHVRRGQVLAKLDDAVLSAQVSRLGAALEQVRAQAALSAAQYRRAKGVESAGALSAEDVEKRRVTLETDAASVKVVAAQLAEAQARLERTRIVAPVGGTVLTRRAEVGQIAAVGGEPLFRIASGGEIEMRGQVAEQDLSQLKLGQNATIHVTGLSEPFAGRVRLLGAVIDPATRLGEIRIALKPDPALRPGAFARAEVTVGRAERPVLPQTAVLSDTQGTYVFIVDGENHIVRQPVRVAGTMQGGIIIADGLKGTERVVATAGGFLRPGERVNVAPPTSSDVASTGRAHAPP